MTRILNVTNKVEFENPDDEALPILKCVCSAKFEPWDFIIDIYKDTPSTCPKCKRKLFFIQSISVLEVLDDK